MKVCPKWLQKQYHLILDIRFLAFATLIISLFVTSLTFLSLANMQQNVSLTDIRFVKDISTVLIPSILVDIEMSRAPSTTSLELIYLSKQSINHIVLLKSNGSILSTNPEDLISYYSQIDWNVLNKNLTVTNLQSQVNYLFFRNQPIVGVLLPFKDISQNTYYLDLGIYYNPSIIFTLFLIRCISIIVFVSIWFTSILSIIVNNISIYSVLEVLSQGLRRIASGNFNTRILHNSRNRFSDLLLDFNEMVKRLNIYEKNNMQQLINEKSKLETLVSIIADGAILLDKDLRIIFINQSAAKTFKSLRSSIRGTYIYTYLPDIINKQILPILNQILESSSLHKNLTCNKTFTTNVNDNGSKTFQFIITHIIDHESQVFTGIAIIIQDITEAIGLNEAKNQFISNVSHELRTPLFNIRSFLDTLSEYQNRLSYKQQKEFLDIASQETIRLSNLVNDVLDLSRLESDFINAIEIIEVFDIIPPIIQASQLRACHKNIELSLEICPNLTAFYGYPNLILQVVSNLIGNSLKFTKSDGRIIVKLYAIKKYNMKQDYQKPKIRIEIIDEGTGIGECDQSRIFDRFVRLENNVHTLEGTGLGLSIVKNIIEKHKAHICLYSELGLGSSFWFDLSIL